MIETRQLHYIITTAELGSFSQAALSLRMKQATLSQRVRDLEFKLGVDLFDRSTKGASLTQAGLQFLRGARHVIAELDLLLDRAASYRDGASGMLSVGISGAVPAAQTQKIFLEFGRLHRDVRVKAKVGNRMDLKEQLMRGQVDAVFLAGHLAPPDSCYRWMGSNRLFAIASRLSALCQKGFVHWVDLRGQKIMIPSGDVGDDLIGQIAHRLPPSGESQDFGRHPLEYDTLCGLMGPEACSIVEESIVSDLPTSHILLPIHEAHGHARLDYGLCWRPNNDNPALRNLLALIDSQAGGRYDDVLRRPDRQP